MDLFNAFCKSAIKVDFTDEFIYGHDTVYDDYICEIPIVTIPLEETDTLVAIANEAMAENGNEPLYGAFGFSFYIGINGYTQSSLDTALTIRCYGGRNCIELFYYLDLTEDEQEVIYQHLNAQIFDKLGKTCDQLIKDAEELYYEGSVNTFANEDFAR